MKTELLQKIDKLFKHYNMFFIVENENEDTLEYVSYNPNIGFNLEKIGNLVNKNVCVANNTNKEFRLFVKTAT